MILSVSRRTDIPAFYSQWFYNRLKAGFVYVRNPMDKHQVSKIPINTEVVDAIVFWTKNPEAMLPKLSALDAYSYYFQFTLNPYNQEIECSVPNKHRIIDTFKKLSDTIGPQKVIWRYDPVLMTNKIGVEEHLHQFHKLGQQLQNYTNTCVISFMDNYKKTERNTQSIYARTLSNNEVEAIASGFSAIAKAHAIKINTCAEKYDLKHHGIDKGRCIDNQLLETIIGAKLKVQKDKNQRPLCGCIQSIDIGEYNTCKHHCLYCYANTNQKMVEEKALLHNPHSPLLIGMPQTSDRITERQVASIIDKNTLF